MVVVDDSDIARGVAEHALTRAGMRVVGVDVPFAVASTVSEVQPDLVLMDVNMPSIRGDKLVEILRKNALPTCPVVLYSDMAASELARLSRAAGADGYIVKSFHPEELVSAVRRYLAAFCRG